MTAEEKEASVLIGIGNFFQSGKKPSLSEIDSWTKSLKAIREQYANDKLKQVKEEVGKESWFSALGGRHLISRKKSLEIISKHISE